MRIKQYLKNNKVALWVKRLSVCALWLGLSPIICADSADVLDLNQISATHKIASGLRYLEDPDHQFGIAEVLANQSWKEHPPGIFNPGLSKSTWWVSFDMLAPKEAEEFFLQVTYPLLDVVDIWILDNDQTLQFESMGDAKVFAERLIEHRFFVLPLSLKPNALVQVVIRVQSTGLVELPLQISPANSFWLDHAYQSLVYGAFFGAILLIALYNFFIFLPVRELNYFLYIAHSLAIALFIATNSGWSYQYLWPNSIAWNNISVVVVSAASALFGGLFIRRTLNFPTIIPTLAKLQLISIGSCVAVIVLTFIIPLQIAVMMLIVTVFSNLTISMIGSLQAFRLKIRVAQYYVAAWGTMLMFILASALEKWSWIPNLGIVEVALPLGLLLEVTALSFALVERINVEKSMRLEANQEARIAEAKSEAKSQFLAAMSHEIRTPMNGVLGLTELLKDSPLNKQQSEYLALIASSGQALMGVINDVLDFSKIEAGKLDIEEIDFDLKTLLGECHELFSFAIADKPVQLNILIEPDVPHRINGDPTRLRQVLNNLLSNAAKFTNEGEINIRVSLEPPQLRVSVSDTGIGIAEANKKTVLESFGQADMSVSRQYGGTGLGLNISKRLAELMGGDLSFSSEEGKGSEFWFTVICKIPQTKPLQPTEEKAGKHESLALAELKSLTVLVAEDNIVNQSVICGMLKRFAVTTIVVDDGAAAVEKFTAEPNRWDLILMDCEMPVLDGYLATEKIRAFEKTLNRQPTPIYALSAHAVQEYKDKSITAGMDGHIDKPIKADSLKAVLLQALALRQPTRTHKAG